MSAVGNAFLHGQGGSGSAKKIQGWVTQNVSASIQANTGSTPLLVKTIEMPGEIATIRLKSKDYTGYGFFYDYMNGYYLKRSGTSLGYMTREEITDETLINFYRGYPEYAEGEYYLYLKKNGKNLEVYQTNTSSDAFTISAVPIEVGYL